MTNTINSAVENAINRISIAQQNIFAFKAINEHLQEKARNKYDKRLESAKDAYWAVLHEELVTAWDQLSYLAPISEKAMDYLAERTRTHFGYENAFIMHFQNCWGSYYTADERAFREEVLAMFGVEEKTQ